MKKASSRTEEDLRAELWIEVKNYPSDAQAAKAFGVSRGHLSRVLHRKKPLTAKLAHGLGYEQQTVFVRYEERQ